MTVVEKIEPVAGPEVSLHDPAADETLCQFVFTGRCPDQPGVVHAVTKFLLDRGCNIREHQQFDDSVRNVVHLRTAFTGTRTLSREALEEDFSSIAEQFGMSYDFHDQIGRAS